MRPAAWSSVQSTRWPWWIEASATTRYYKGFCQISGRRPRAGCSATASRTWRRATRGHAAAPRRAGPSPLPPGVPLAAVPSPVGRSTPPRARARSGSTGGGRNVTACAAPCGPARHGIGCPGPVDGCVPARSPRPGSPRADRRRLRQHADHEGRAPEWHAARRHDAHRSRGATVPDTARLKQPRPPRSSRIRRLQAERVRSHGLDAPRPVVSRPFGRPAFSRLTARSGMLINLSSSCHNLWSRSRYPSPRC